MTECGCWGLIMSHSGCIWLFVAVSRVNILAKIPYFFPILKKGEAYFFPVFRGILRRNFSSDRFFLKKSARELYKYRNLTEKGSKEYIKKAFLDISSHT